jgi:hypothetical protein
MEIRIQPCALASGKEHLVSDELEKGQVLESVWMFGGKKIS